MGPHGVLKGLGLGLDDYLTHQGFRVWETRVSPTCYCSPIPGDNPGVVVLFCCLPLN